MESISARVNTTVSITLTFTFDYDLYVHSWIKTTASWMVIKSKILAVLTTKEAVWGFMMTWNFDIPVYLPLKGSTDRREFMLSDEFHTDKNVAFVKIII